jgi:hypothetical protein
VWKKNCFKEFPPGVQQQYSQHANGLGVNNDFTTLATLALNQEILDDRNTYKSIQDALEQHYQTIKMNAKEDYVDFVMQYGEAYTSARNVMADFMTGDPTPTTAERSLLVWPLLVEDVFHSENGLPKEDGITKLFNLYFDIIEKELL